MAVNKNTNWERWVQGELIASLQSKGQLPKKQTEASQYKNKAYSNTHTRIFPPEEDDPSYAANMLADARSKLTRAAEHIEHSQHKEQQQQQLAAATLSLQQGLGSGAAAGPVGQQEDEPRPGSACGSLVGSQVGSQAGSQVRSPVRSKAGSQAGSLAGSQLGSQMQSQARSHVGSEASCRTNKTTKSETKARIADLQKQLAQEKSNVGALQEALDQAKQKSQSLQK